MVVSVGDNIDESFCFIERQQHQWEVAVISASSYTNMDDSFAESNVDDLSGGNNDTVGNFSGQQHQGEFDQLATMIAFQ